MARNLNPPIKSDKNDRTQGKSNLRTVNSRLVLMLAAGVGLLIIVILTVYLTVSSQPLVSSTDVREASFSIYSPKNAPDGYEFMKERVSYTNSTFSYIFKEIEGGNELTVTIQAKPDSFDMSSMSEGGSINSTSTRNGSLYNLSASGSSQYLLDTGGSLVFFRSSETIDNSTMVGIADDLVKIN